MNPKLPPKAIQLRPGDLNVTELYHEAAKFGFGSNLSAYLRWLIRLGRGVAGRKRGGNRAKKD